MPPRSKDFLEVDDHTALYYAEHPDQPPLPPVAGDWEAPPAVPAVHTLTEPDEGDSHVPWLAPVNLQLPILSTGEDVALPPPAHEQEEAPAHADMEEEEDTVIIAQEEDGAVELQEVQPEDAESPGYPTIQPSPAFDEQDEPYEEDENAAPAAAGFLPEEQPVNHSFTLRPASTSSIMNWNTSSAHPPLAPTHADTAPQAFSFESSTTTSTSSHHPPAEHHHQHELQHPHRRNLARMDPQSTTLEDLAQLASDSPDIHTFLRAIQLSRSPRLFVLTMRLFTDYARVHDEKLTIFADPQVLEFIARIMRGHDWLAQECAAEVIRTLTAHEAMDPFLMNAPGLLSLLSRIAQGGDGSNDDFTGLVIPQARIHASIAIMNLSCGQGNKATLASSPEVLQALKLILLEPLKIKNTNQSTQVLSFDETLRLKATTTLKNLSNLDTNDVHLISFPGLVHALGQVILETSCASPTGATPITTNACMTLMNLSISKHYKCQVYHTPGVMQALLTVLSRTSSQVEEGSDSVAPTNHVAAAQEARTRACSVLSNLAIGYNNKVSMFLYPHFIETILLIIREDKGEARSKACSILWSLAAEMENQVPMVKRSDVLPELIQVASEHNQRNSEARQKCVACLTLLAEAGANAISLLQAGILRPLFEILNEAGSDPTQWKDHTASWCVSCLMNLAQVDAAVPVLRESGAVQMLAPLVVLDQHYQSLKAAMAVTLCCRLDNHFQLASQQEQQSCYYYNILRKTETAIPKIVSLLHNTLAGRGGEGYKFGVFTLCSSVACIAALAQGPDFLKEHICTTPVLVSLLQVLWDFCVDGGVPGCIVGGGRDDFASARWAVEAIHSIVSYLLEQGCGDDALFSQPSLTDPLICALTSVREKLEGSTGDHRKLTTLAGNAARLIMAGLRRNAHGHSMSIRRTPYIEPEARGASDTTTFESSFQDKAAIPSRPQVDDAMKIDECKSPTSVMNSFQSNCVNRHDADQTPVQTFLLLDTRTGLRFVVPTKDFPSAGSHQWCFRRGRYCSPGETPDPNYLWTPDLQRAYRMALGQQEGDQMI